MSKKQDESKNTEPPEQLSDLLLLVNTKKKSIRVAADEKGKTDRLDKINHDNPPFLKIDRSSIVENFLSNYFSQSKDPTEFRFFRVPIEVAKKMAGSLRELFKENPSQEIQDFAKQYEVKQDLQSQADKNNNSLKEEDMNTSTETQNGKPLRYNEAMINWEQLKDFGISRDYLKEKGLLDEMLKGYKTSKLVPVTANFGSAVLRTDARLSLQQSKEGPIVLAMHGIRREPELNRAYFGYNFSDEDKTNLKNTGNMGRQAMIAPQGSAEKVPYLISIDKLTNEIVGVRADRAFIPEEVSGVKLTDHEKETLREGKAIFVEDMISKSGKEFNAHLQINAEKRGIEYIFPDRGQFNREEIGGVELTKKQLEDLHTGKAIFVEDMKRKDGEQFSSFIKLDANGTLSYSRVNPDTGELYIPKEICNVRLTREDKDALRTGSPVFLENMISRKGEEFSSFVKIDTETGRISYSRTLDGFEEKPAYKVPQEMWGVAFTVTQRADLQDGKAVHITGMTGYNGQKFDSWLKVNQNQGRIDFYISNPDKPRLSENITKSNKEAIERERTQRPAARQRKIA
jgi:hypothetical protein